MSLQISGSFKQLQIWTSEPLLFEDEELIEKIKQTYLECQNELTYLSSTYLSSTFGKDQKKKIKEFVQLSAVMEQFLDSATAKNVFSHLDHSLDEKRAQLHEQEKSHGLAQLPRMVQIVGHDKDLKERCLSLLIPLQDHISFFLDLLEQKPVFGKALVDFLLSIEKPEVFLKKLSEYYEKNAFNTEVYEKMILDTGFPEIYFNSNSRIIPKLIQLYQKDESFTKKFILIDSKDKGIILEIAHHSIPLASKILEIFSLSQDIQHACSPFFELKIWVKSGKHSLLEDCDVDTLEKIVPFFNWVIKTAYSGESKENLVTIINTAYEFITKNEPIACILLGLPDDKQSLWHKVYDKTDNLKKLTVSDVQKIFSEQEEDELFIEQFEPWDGNIWISALCSLPTETQILLDSFLDKTLPKSSALNLEEKLPKLSLKLRKIFVQLIALSQKEPQILKPFITFVNECSNEASIKKILKLLTAFPMDGEKIVPFVLKDIGRLEHFILLNKDKDRCRKFVDLMNELDPMLLEFILSKGLAKFDAMLALAQSKPHLLAALVEIDGLVDVNSMPYLIDAIDEESADLLLRNASFRHKLLHEIKDAGRFFDLEGPVFRHNCPFSLIVKALKHNQDLTLEIISLSQNHPILMKQLLEELLGKKGKEKPFYEFLLDLRIMAKSKEDEKNIEMLLMLVVDKEKCALPLLEIAHTKGLAKLANLLELHTDHRPVLEELLKHFPDPPLKERVLSLASASSVPLLKALLIVKKAKNSSFFQKMVEDTTVDTLALSLQMELLKTLFPIFPPALEAWGEKLYKLYGKEGIPPKGEDLFLQLPQEVRDLLFELASLIGSINSLGLQYFEKFILHFPNPSLVSQFLKAANLDFYKAINQIDFMIEYPDCAPLLVEGLAKGTFTWIAYVENDNSKAFLIKHAPYIVTDLKQLEKFYWGHRIFIDRIISDSHLSELDKLNEICNETKKTQVEQTSSFSSLRDKIKKVFPKDPSLQQQFSLLIQKGFSKEISELLNFYENQKDSSLVQTLLNLITLGEGRLLYACLHIKGSKQGDELLHLLSEQKESNRLLNQLIIESAAGHWRLVNQLLPNLLGEAEDSYFLNLLNHNEGAFAESLLVEKGKYPEEIHSVSSIPVRKELFYLSRIDSKPVVDFCFAFCQEIKDEKETIKRLGHIQYLIVHNRPLIENLVNHSSEKEVFQRIETEIAKAISQFDKKIEQQADEYQGKFKELALAKSFSLWAADMILTAAGTINYSLLMNVKESAFCQIQIKKGTSTGDYLQEVFQSFRDNSAISIKISSIKTPEALSSPSVQLIREICELPSDAFLTDRYAQMAVLSALISRPRQSASIGSCFGTNILIQTLSSPENLLFVLDDYASLVTNGKITRTLEKNGLQYTIDFPVRLFAKDSKKEIEDEHLLVKTLEFIIASMANKSENLVQKNLSHFNSWGFIGIRLWGINYRNVQNGLEIIERDEILQAMREAFLQTVDAIYDPFAQHKGEQSSFNLIDRETLRPIYEDNQYRDLLVKVIKKAQQNLEERMLEKSEVLLRTFTELILWMSGNVDQSDSFLGSLGYKQGDEGILSLYAIEGGANVPRCRYIYYEELKEHVPTQEITLPNNVPDVKSLVQLIEQMSQEEKEIYLKNPSKLAPMGIKGHAMSFMPGPLIQQLAQGKTADDLLAAWQLQAKEIGQTILEKNQKNMLITNFLLKLSKKNHALFEGAIKQSNLLEKSVNLAEFAQGMLEIAQHIEGSFIKMKKWASKLEAIIFKVIPEAKFTTLQIGDCNWNAGYDNIYLSLGISPITEQVQTYITNSDHSYMRPFELESFKIYSDLIIPQKAKLC